MGHDIEQNVAREYAQAVFEAAQATGALAEIGDELHSMGQIIRTQENLRCFLVSPVIDKQDKETALVRMFQGRVNGVTLSFLRVVARRRRLGMLGEVIRQFQLLMDEHLGIERGDVVTARPLDKKEQARLNEELSRALKTKIVLSHRVDQDIVGGMVVTVGDRRYDGSVRTKLKRFAAQFTQRPVTMR
ncbi:MAG: ATP synthase F1 subunit delta [Sedimentisphaerales bacterium]|nr:ATP synthase F1 subunit delta [Sedimentisphaerales bacterium]